MGTDADVLEPDVGGTPEIDIEISDEELATLALAADPDGAADPDAVPFRADEAGPALLPAWYMAVPMTRVRGRARRVVLVGIIGALLLINGAGLCVTYGFPEIAW